MMESAPTPDEFLMLPLGGTREIGSHKGYSLAVMIDILSGIMANAGSALFRFNGVGHHFTVFNIASFTDVDEFKGHMDEYLKALRETPTAPGEERVIYAGLEEHEAEIDRSERGIPYHPEVIEWFRSAFGDPRGQRPLSPGSSKPGSSGATSSEPDGPRWRATSRIARPIVLKVQSISTSPSPQPSGRRMRA